MNLFEQLQVIIATTLDISPDSIQSDSNMESIGEWDSLGHVHIMVALEQTFDLYMDIEDFAELDSVNKILTYIKSETGHA